jgi:uncharacterized protein YndB with AHSA1/START domain
MAGHVAEAEVHIIAPAKQVWAALTDPDLISQYMFGSRVETDWKPGSPITWKGEYDGKSYEDKGEVLDADEPRLLRVTHYSPMSGKPDVPDSYHTVAYQLDEHDGTTHVLLTQDNNASTEEVEHSQRNWQSMLEGLKEVVEAAG